MKACLREWNTVEHVVFRRGERREIQNRKGGVEVQN